MVDESRKKKDSLQPMVASPSLQTKFPYLALGNVSCFIEAAWFYFSKGPDSNSGRRRRTHIGRD